MIKNVAIVSLSAGTIGEDFVRHEVEIGLKRLADYGLNVRMMPNAMKGIEYLKEHPEERAKDLIQAFQDDTVDMILCAIGGDDTYRLLPYLFDNDELKHALHKKIFLGFSDSTINHLMLHKLGLNTFYGQSFLADICELDNKMLDYTAHYFEELIQTGTIKRIEPGSVWYEERTDWSQDAIGTSRKQHDNGGFELLQGKPVFHGKILGGCIDTIYDIFDSSRYEDSAGLCKKYELFPDIDDWKGKILLLETSEEQPSPEHYRIMLETLKKTGIFSVVSGIICGKPMDEKYFDAYKKIIKEAVADPALPIVANINVGHATPRCIIPFGVEAVVNADKQYIEFTGSNVCIRPAEINDAERILDIYSYYVKNTAITFEYEVPSLAEFRSRMKNTMEKYPYLVIEKDGKTEGYAYAGAFKGRAAYDWSCELTIYLDRTVHKCGLGRQLYEALENELYRMGILNLYACIGYPETEDEYLNKNSAEFHAHMGFSKVGEFNKCGYKFGRWYNMIWMEKVIGNHLDQQPPVDFRASLRMHRTSDNK